MLSHELAHLLLARRDNDVRIEVLLDDDPTGETYRTYTVELRCDDTLIDSNLRGGEVVCYSPLADATVIRAGCITLIDPEAAADRDDTRAGKPAVALNQSVKCGHRQTVFWSGASWVHPIDMGTCDRPPHA